MTDQTFDVLLTNSDSRASLALTRSLARHGISALLAADKPTNLALYSRAAKHFCLGPSASKDPKGFVRFILDTVRKHRIRLVIPVTDLDLITLERHRSALEAETTLAMANSRAVRCVLDKRWNLEVAGEFDVPCPKQFELTDLRQIPDMIKYLGFPMVLKNPGLGADLQPSPFKFKVLFAHNESELRNDIAQHCRSGLYPIFQECVVGNVHNVCCFTAGGELVAAHEYHSIRRFEGVGVLRTIVEPMPELVVYARRMLKALQWDGVAHLGFFISKDHSKAWYMETNGRFWASTQGSVHAGWDFPYWVCNYFLNGQSPDVGKIEVGSTTCWHLGDLLALVGYFRGGEFPSTGAEHGKFTAVLKYLSGFGPGIHSEVFEWGDPLPGVMENWHVLKRALAQAGRLTSRQIARLDFQSAKS
jgi:predicted ATP-grasp superfamily ATP-dependent carboligase